MRLGAASLLLVFLVLLHLALSAQPARQKQAQQAQQSEQATKQQTETMSGAKRASQLASSKSSKSSVAKQQATTTDSPHLQDKQDSAYDDDDEEEEEDDEENADQLSSVGRQRQEKRLADWLRQSKQDAIELVNGDILELLMEHMNHLVVFFYEPSQCAGTKSSSGNKCKRILQELENIDDDTDQHGIQFVKCEDAQFAKSLGINTLPALVYFEQNSAAPSIYSGDLEQEEQVLEWLVTQKEEDTIENINRDILASIIMDGSQQEAKKRPGKQVRASYIACIFYKANDPQSDQLMEQLESIDDDLSEFGIQLVKLADDLIAKKYGVRKAPGLVLFRNGEPLKYTGSLSDTEELLQWLTKPKNLETGNSIEWVNEKMFHKFLQENHQLVVLFHSESGNSCKQCKRVLEQLETIDDELAQLGLTFVKLDSSSIARKYGIHALPALVYLNRAEGSDVSGSHATIYAGDLRKADDLLQWLTERQFPNQQSIPELTGRQCRELIKTKEHVAIYVYSEEAASVADKSAQDKVNVNDDDDDDDDDDEEEEGVKNGGEDSSVLAGLENIDSECRRQNIEFVKTHDRAFIKEFGLDDEVDDLPALIYFERGQPSIYEGDLAAEEDLLDWLLHQSREDTIEEVNRRLLERLIESSHYLVVLFYKSSHCKSCQTVLDTLERIDDDCDAYGIAMVKINDLALAKRYGIKTFPALVYFRNGNPLVYAGDLKDESQVLEWLLDDEQRELNDEIEDINGRMLDKLIDSSPFLAVLFYDDDDCAICPKVLHELEKIDDDTDTYGIDFVKVNDFQAARKYNVHTFPTLVYFRRQTPSYYDGDLLDEERVLSWLTSNDVFELEDEIEEVNKKMLDKLLETSDYIAVLFYEKNCKHCEEVLKELEHIDDEADSLDIMFVKIRDMSYAKKFGISQAPSLVYFRKKFPSIYRGDLTKEEKVLEWLRKNRYRNPELNLFLYALFTITISFILYTIFLVFCVKKKQD